MGLPVTRLCAALAVAFPPVKFAVATTDWFAVSTN
jgi:hypothetical protein